MSSMDLELLDRVERMVNHTKERAWKSYRDTCRGCYMGTRYTCISCSADYDSDVRESERKHDEDCELAADIVALESYIRIERDILEEEKYAQEACDG